MQQTCNGDINFVSCPFISRSEHLASRWK